MVLSTYTRNYVQQGLWANRRCKTRRNGETCTSTFEGQTLKLRTRRMAGSTVELQLGLAHTDFCSPGALAPVRVTLLHSGGARTGLATSCTTQAGGGSGWRTSCVP